ncbi:MAG: hypothetical protein QM773_03415 [Hyphomonadaceae bacterium]
MIHPQDWEVLLRLPRPGTMLTLLAFIAIPTLVVMLPVLGFRYLGRGRFDIPARDIKRLFILIVAIMTAFVLWLGISGRMWQAACWRLGPEGMPPQDQDVCRNMPPHGVEGFY